ncbi:Non-heme chloroperoxidase [Burkholderia sp. AD24]|nr:Non-heme chloroperoxidase [Burkholderia sp. AD24]
MGGVIAVLAALEKPERMTHLVLTVTSGGIDMRGSGAQDWRRGFLEANSSLPDWFVSFESDLTPALERVSQPVLLLWGDADPYSPVADARLHVVSGGNHDLANVHAEQLAPIVDAHLLRT